jgi:hypothetical protein
VIYICIPAHNEERTVGVLLWKVRQVMASFPRDYQILVANDGSTDATAEVLSPYQRVLPLTVVHIEQRRGYATALELLLREAVRRAEYPKRDVVVTLQADLTDDPDELLGMLKRIEAGADIVVANARLPDAAGRTIRWARQLGNLLLKKRGWPEGVNDALCGLRAFRVVVLKRALETRAAQRLLTWDGWIANAELLHLAQAHSRRTDVVEYTVRSDRRQRPSRHTLWPVIQSSFQYTRDALGPLANTALPVSSTVDLRDRRKAARSAERASEPGDGARNLRPGRTRGSEKEPAGDRSPDRRRTRPARGEKPARGKPHVERGSPVTDERKARVEKRRERRRSSKRDPARPAEAAASELGPGGNGAGPEPPAEAAGALAPPPAAGPARRKRRRKRRGGTARSGSPEATQVILESEVESSVQGGPQASEPGGDGASAAGETPGPRKRRSRRGGRGRRGRGRARNGQDVSTKDNGSSEVPSPGPGQAPTDAAPARDVQLET